MSEATPSSNVRATLQKIRALANDSSVAPMKLRLQSILGLADSALQASDEPAVIHDRPLSAVQRLHNICDALSEQADESPFTREEWDAIDKETVRLQNRVKELESEVSTLRDHLGEQNRLLSLNVAALERERAAQPPTAPVTDADELSAFWRWYEQQRRESFVFAYGSDEPIERHPTWDHGYLAAKKAGWMARAALTKPATNGGMKPTCPNCGHEPCAEWCSVETSARRAHVDLRVPGCDCAGCSVI